MQPGRTRWARDLRVGFAGLATTRSAKQRENASTLYLLLRHQHDRWDVMGRFASIDDQPSAIPKWLCGPLSFPIDAWLRLAASGPRATLGIPSSKHHVNLRSRSSSSTHLSVCGNSQNIQRNHLQQIRHGCTMMRIILGRPLLR